MLPNTAGYAKIFGSPVIVYSTVHNNDARRRYALRIGAAKFATTFTEVLNALSKLLSSMDKDIDDVNGPSNKGQIIDKPSENVKYEYYCIKLRFVGVKFVVR